MIQYQTINTDGKLSEVIIFKVSDVRYNHGTGEPIMTEIHLSLKDANTFSKELAEKLAEIPF